MPVDPVLPHDLDDLYGPGAENAMDYDDELKELEDNITEDIEEAISKLATEDTWLKEIQPPTSIVGLAAEAAAKVLIAFERGYRMEKSSEE